jgi:site-specific DNA-methyltransferase (adenine-specific)
MVQYDSIYLGNCISVLKTVPAGAAKLIATDPPFNIGLKYDLYDDKKDYRAYLAWCKEWLTECHRVLAPNGSIYVCIGDEYQAEINVLLKELGFYWRNTIIWYYTFGENQKNKFNRTHTVIHYFSKSSTEVAFYPDAVKVPSKRMLMGDKRAKAGGKIPDDVWESTSLEDHAPSALPADWTEWKMGVLNTVLRAGIKLNKAIDMVEEAAPSGVGDVWKISRVCGTFKERIVDENRSGTVCFTLTTEANVICEDQADTVVTVLVDGGALGAGPRPGIGGHGAVMPRSNGGKVCSTNEGPCACGKRHMPGDADVMANPFVSRSTV